VAERDALAWDEMVLIGRIARPHGLKGHVVVNPETDFIEERFAAGSGMWTRRAGAVERLTIAQSRMQGRRPVVAFDGFSRIEEVEPLAGCELRIPESELRPLAAGQYYEHQLAGCTVETVGGERVGTVLRVEGGLAGSCLVIAGPRGEVLVPFVAAMCPEVDIAAKRIRIDPPDGLLDVNTR
jgi:16S rRNA processing protein RimM